MHRRIIRSSIAVAGAVALAVGVAAAASASGAGSARTGGGVANPYSPAYGHSYRHGAVPTIPQMAKMRAWDSQHSGTAAPAAVGPNTLSYQGGRNGIGVTSGHSQVYLVFYGNQWGTQSVDGNGNAKFSGDAYGAASAVQQMYKGIGTNNELWSADLTQWCDGPAVAVGATSCPANANFIPYQAGGVLSGVWYDNAAASPGTATDVQLGQEAVKAAAHFGNTSAASNRYTYYVILSPHGTHPDGFPNANFCAWHSDVNSAYGDLAFSNEPYTMDTNVCGMNFVNAGSAGSLDGYTMTIGHEWHETLSDQLPESGWVNAANGQENSDECAWIAPGQSGGAANISFGSFGSYAEQSSWSNDTNSCAISHPIVNGGAGNTVTVTNPGSRTSTVGTAITPLQIAATDSASGQTLTYSASSLPNGLSVNASTGVISGTPSVSGSFSVRVTATDTTGASGSATFTWTVNASGSGVVNGGFEAGSLSGWTTTGAASVVNTGAHSGTYAARVGSTTPTNGDSTAAQTFTTSANGTLSFWYDLICPDTVQYDWATASLKDNTTGTTTTVLAKTCVANSGWTKVSTAVTAGHSYSLTIASHDDNYSGDATYTYYDDVAIS